MLSPQQAADRAGVSRKAIMDAIKAEKLRATQSNEDGRWNIREESLEVWMEGRSQRSSTTKAATYDDASHDIATTLLLEKVSYLEARVVELSQEREEAKEGLAAERKRADQAMDSVLEATRDAQREREREAERRETERVRSHAEIDELRRRAEEAEKQVSILSSTPSYPKPKRGILRLFRRSSQEKK